MLGLLQTTGVVVGAFEPVATIDNVRLLKDAKENACDYLIVLLHTTDEEKVEEKIEMLLSMKYVDEVIPYKTQSDLNKLLKMLKIDVRIYGKEYTADALEENSDIPSYVHKSRKILHG